MNSGPEKKSTLKRTENSDADAVRFSVLLVLAEEFIPRRKWCLKSTWSSESKR